MTKAHTKSQKTKLTVLDQWARYDLDQSINKTNPCRQPTEEMWRGRSGEGLRLAPPGSPHGQSTGPSVPALEEEVSLGMTGRQEISSVISTESKLPRSRSPCHTHGVLL